MRTHCGLYLGLATLATATIAWAQPATQGHLTLICHIQWNAISPDPDYNLDVNLRSNTVDGRPAQISEGAIVYDVPIPNDTVMLFHVEINRYTGTMLLTARSRDGSEKTYGGNCTRATEPKF